MCKAAEAVCPGVAVGLKWPNDLEVNGRKLGGILCEHGHGPVITGIGLTAPNGNRLDEYRDSLLNCRSGVGPYEIRYVGKTIAC